TDVTFSAISRVWKVVENVSTGGDIPTVEVAILKSAVRTATPPDGRYLMFISDTPNFDPTADYRVMTEATNELGEAILKTNYDFDNTKYITFGWAPERRFERSVYFNGVDSYMDMEDALNLNQAAFTISAWVMREANATNKSILSKRDAAYTEGYDFKINASGKLEVSWRTPLGVAQIITSNTTIPQNTWHHLAIIYNGTTATLYIDGVQDTQANLLQPGNTNQSFFIGAAAKLAPEAFFHGNIDEVRIWNTAISVDQLRYIMNQEIKENAGTIGASYFMDEAITPTKNEIASIPWSSLDAYYPMSTYTYTNTKDESGNGHQGALRTLRTVDRQTAPLPYKTVATGTSDWDLNTTWLYGPYQTIPGAASIVDNTITVDWNIVETDDNINMNNSSLPATANENRTLLALVNKSSEITVEGDNSTNTGFGLTITHYLQLDGKIDLEGESQLIQTTDSDLVVGTNGALEKDQQGTRDLFTYNYWSAPVGYTATTNPNNYRYTLNDNIMKDGTNPLAPVNINYIGGYDGSNGSPIGIAHYWIWKFNNYLSDDYASWQHVRNTGTLLAGEGFTMKGVNNTNGAVHLEQNYVFEGKPNNGNISLPINAGNEYLVGNPYASALDAQQFITDNGPTISGAGTDPTISGTLYFWEHWGGGSHILREYQGGYATYNYSGGTPAAAMGTSDPDVATGGTPTKIPGDYIPVGQGFFVEGETNGNIIFNNTQRIFQKEGGTASVFVRNNEEASPTANADLGDERTKVRLGFNSVNTIRRQLLVTVDERATANYDWGFDAKNLDTQIDDMSWLIAGELYIIQGINEINQTTILPISIKTRDEGLNSITIDALVNFPDHLQIYVHDKDLGMYHNLRSSDYQINLPAGEYSERFEITFSEESLSIEELEANDLDASYVNESESIVIKNPNNLEIEKVEILNILGQTIYTFEEDTTSNFLEYKTNKLSTGTYILKLKTKNTTWSKKVLIN
ncbi:LamG-like jellyroll fold domain-containing protein, partial [Oceanihabitans sediminis]|uniref:LamG-like jellyroll fold domain-containing protein n=1 Tax=Oceanihabitans sediminis TaxID=1812012 RepID=UPI003A8D2AB3